MECRINPKYKCFHLFKSGKGKWSYRGYDCSTCIIYQSAHQITLEQADPNTVFKCPKCKTSNIWYLHETEVFRCKYCGTLFRENEALRQ